jgi:hypothetical protein
LPKNNNRISGKATSRKNRSSLTKPTSKQNLETIKNTSIQPDISHSLIAIETNYDNPPEQSTPIETKSTPIPKPMQVSLSINDVFFKKELTRMAILGSFTILLLAIISFTIKSN